MALMVAAYLPTGSRGRMLALGILAILLLLSWFGLVAPLIDLHDRESDRLIQRAEVWRTMARLAGDLPALRRREEIAAKAGPPPSLTLPGASDAVAAAQLQNRIQDIIAKGASLTSTEILQTEIIGRYRRIGLKLSLEASWPVLIAFLRAVEQSNPPVLVDDLQIHAGPPTPAGTPPLHASLVVYAFRDGGGDGDGARETRP